MARRGVEVTSAEDKWEVGGGMMSLGWAGWGAECAHGLCAFPLLPYAQKVRNGICEQGCDEKLIPKKSSLSG